MYIFVLGRFMAGFCASPSVCLHFHFSLPDFISLLVSEILVSTLASLGKIDRVEDFPITNDDTNAK